MLTRLAMLSWAADADDAGRADVLDSLRRLGAIAASVASSFIAEDLPPNRNGGDVIWRLEFADAADHAALTETAEWQGAYAAIEQSDALQAIDMAVYEPLAVGERGIERSGGLYRLLLFAVDDTASTQDRERFETEMAAMPDYVSTILRWNFGRVTQSSGARRWAYMWEQEFADITGFRGEYMAHPYHWGFLDRWYDSDNPIRLVDPYLCNSFCAIDEPVMFAKAARPAATRFPG